jgi:hypothetical protein
MTIRFPIKLDGDTATALLSLPDEPSPPVVVPGYDLDAAFAAEALGLESPLAVLARDWEKGIAYFLAQGNNFETFIDILRSAHEDEHYEEELERMFLPLTRLSAIFNETLKQILEQRAVTGGRAPVSLGEFFEQADYLDFWGYYDTDIDWDNDSIAEALRVAFDDKDGTLWNQIIDYYDDGGAAEAVEVEEGVVNCGEENEVLYHCEQEINLYVLGDHIESFTLKGTWSFADAELNNWELTESEDSETPDTDTDYFLSEIGVDTNWEQMLEDSSWSYAESPHVPEGDGEGPWVVYINGNKHDRFLDPDEAERFAELSNMASQGLWEASVEYDDEDDEYDDEEEKDEDEDEDEDY